MGRNSTYPYKTVTVTEICQHFDQILKYVTSGEEVLVLKHNQIIAKLIPVSSDEKSEKWPDFVKRARAIFGESPLTKASDTLIETRRDRF